MAAAKRGFGKDFLWGASTAAHQVEGGNHNQWTVWELEYAKVKAVQAHYELEDFPSWDRAKKEAQRPENYVSDLLADHYHRYKEDFDLLEKMHMNSYRFSIEWSRIEPEEGVWDASEITHYRDYLKELKRRHIEPVVTLFHFSLPVWFAAKGGFEKRGNVKHFVNFAEKIMEELGDSFTYVITVNEPEVYTLCSYVMGMWPPVEKNYFAAFRVVNNLIYAHNKVAKMIHKLGKHHKVSLAKHSVFAYPGDSAWVSKVSALVVQYIVDDYIMRRVRKTCDFLGLNYYQSLRLHGYRIHNPEQPLNDLNWVMAPDDIEHVLERMHRRYHLPILITENGVADDRDEHREWWLKETLLAMQAAMGHGVEILGYLHWSLLDNSEWSYGKWPRFGLAAVDYQTGKRTLRPSAHWFGRTIKRLRGI